MILKKYKKFDAIVQNIWSEFKTIENNIYSKSLVILAVLLILSIRNSRIQKLCVQEPKSFGLDGKKRIHKRNQSIRLET